MKALVFDDVAVASDGYAALALRDVPVPRLGRGEVLVRMTMAAINPADFMFMADAYVKSPSLPGQIAGLTGAGVIAEAGDGCTVREGEAVSIWATGSWAEYAVVPETSLVVLPAGYPQTLASQFSNLISAADILDLAGVRPGGWLALTAAQSTVARIALQLARARGVRTIAIVRRRKGAPIDGADAVIALEELEGSLTDAIRAATSGAPLSGVADCVGGPGCADLLRLCDFRSRVVIFGNLRSEPLGFTAADMLIKSCSVLPYAFRFFFEPPTERDRPQIDALVAQSTQPGFTHPVGGIHPLEDYRAAIDGHATRTDLGKRFFSIAEA
ncbi:MAG TPA: zinc-binding dehydrogenase [Allosphingosinicella sp.]|nr:zinc-binding dehydrogenase [Allosphingosinicella sp.]